MERTICNKIRQTGEWPTPWTQSLVITLPKKGNLQLCQNYRMIGLISHRSKVMLNIILNRLKPQAEKIIAEEQACFRAARSTTDQILNLRILCEKYLQHQHLPCLHRLQEGLRQCLACSFMGNHEEVEHRTNLFQIIKNLYNKASSVVLFNSSIGDWFRTTVEVRQGCLLSPTLFDIFLERITTDV